MDALTRSVMEPNKHIHEVTEIEIAHLDLRYAHTRVHKPENVSSLMHSIQRCGQIVPVAALMEKPSCFVLMDGYLRVSALKRCGRDTVLAEIWNLKEQEALVRVLARSNDRRWDAIEQAALIRELRDKYSLSQVRIASLLGRKQAWVSGRVALIDALPDDVLEIIRNGKISTWAASRVIAPIARAIPAHARMLTENLAREYISTRDLSDFFRHYQKSNRTKREKMVKEPALFIKALHCAEQENQANCLKEGPEGRWIKELKMAGHIIRGLIKQVPSVIYEEQSSLDRRILVTAFEDTRKLMLSLEKEIRRFSNEDNSRHKTNHSDIASAGNQDPKDQPNPQHIKEQCSSGPAGTNKRCDFHNIPVRGDNADHSGAFQTLQG
ncbi:MAG: chromosome partitioning protein ParB [Desulfobacteraceae bacterium]|nr:MAG: chromosome partitioning protein ParB [Desulfobacteraceae bacterium]